ncbi:MAG: prolipoprotein diacylglyceryl transferase [Candidatus Omnitrophota bacterium]
MYRILLKLGIVNIYAYGLMLALAFIAGSWLLEKRARKLGVSRNKVLDLVFYMLISGILGARLIFVFLNWGYYKNNLLDIIKFWEGGLVFYGGLVLAFFVALYFLKRNKLPVWKFADAIAPCLALGIAIGRIGCFLNGCCYGRISWQWGISFPARDNPPVYAQQVFSGIISPQAQCSLPVIPTQLYSSLSALAIFFVLLALGRKIRPEGFLFWMFILLYSLGRFIIEAFRYYEPNFFIGALTVSQIISFILILLSVFSLIFISSKKNH